jgi:hypothetical protein
MIVGGGFQSVGRCKEEKSVRVISEGGEQKEGFGAGRTGPSIVCICAIRLLFVLLGNSFFPLRSRGGDSLAPGQDEFLNGQEEQESEHGSDGDGDKDLMESCFHGSDCQCLLALVQGANDIDIFADGGNHLGWESRGLQVLLKSVLEDCIGERDAQNRPGGSEEVRSARRMDIRQSVSRQ